MAVYKRGYSRYTADLTSRWQRLLAVPRFMWSRLFGQRFVVALFVGALFWPMLCSLFVYVSNHSELWSGFGREMAKMLEINGKFFLVFMNVQSVFAMILAAMAGPGLIAPDIANNALPLYFSRPLSRVDYVLARFIVLAGLLSLVTIVPALFLLTMQIGLAGVRWAMDFWYLPAGVLAGFALWILVVSLVALACSAYVKWRVVSGALVLAFFFLLAGAAEMMNAVFRTSDMSIFNPAKALNRIWAAMLRTDPDADLSVTLCAVFLAALAALLILVLERKLRPVEVIS
jgi:ABC-2 type transport system permease protein